MSEIIEGFHVTSYQAKFASHHTRDRHVGSTQHGAILEIQQNTPLLII